MKYTSPLNVPFIASLVLGAFVLVAATFHLVTADATTAPTVTPATFKEYTFFATSTSQTFFATTTTATSTDIISWFNSNGEKDNGYFVIAGARNVTFYLGRGDTLGTGNSGSTSYKVQVTPKTSPSESDWYNFNDFISATTTTTYTSVVLAGTSTFPVSMDVENRGFYATRVVVSETTDGEHSVSATATF